MLALKIEQLNSAIDEVAAEYRSESPTNGLAMDSDEVESIIWKNCCIGLLPSSPTTSGLRIIINFVAIVFDFLFLEHLYPSFDV